MPDELGEEITCEPGACLLRPRAEGVGALLAQGTKNSPFCADAAVVVSAVPAQDACPRPSPLLVDRFTVWREGAAAIWLGPGGVRILTDRAERGDRPWVPQAQARRGTELPAAMAD